MLALGVIGSDYAEARKLAVRVPDREPDHMQGVDAMLQKHVIFPLQSLFALRHGAAIVKHTNAANTTS